MFSGYSGLCRLSPAREPQYLILPFGFGAMAKAGFEPAFVDQKGGVQASRFLLTPPLIKK